MSFLGGFAGGVAAAFTVAPFAEHAVHEHILHIPPSKREGKLKYFRAASESHHDEHHQAFKGAAHYYRDQTNKHAVSAFGKGDIGVIAAVGAVLGTTFAAAYAAAARHAPGNGEFGFALGFEAATLTYYGLYEFTHKYMHDIGRRRKHINERIGSVIQGGRGDGKLLLSKPLLDDICTSIENQVDRSYPLYSFSCDDNLASRLNTQLAKNREWGAYVGIAPGEEAQAFVRAAKIIGDEEWIRRGRHGLRRKFTYALERFTQRTLRNNRYFQFIDNHHFLHHYKIRKNLNVVAPIADVVRGTFVDSSRSYLEDPQNAQYWICPNSPDTKPFEKKERLVPVKRVA